MRKKEKYIPHYDDPEKRERFLRKALETFEDTLQLNFEELRSQVEAWREIERRDRFLDLSAVYKYFVKQGQYLTSDDQDGKKEYDVMGQTFKFVAIVSIIEATMKEKSYTDFFGWLNSRQRVKFPICDKCQLEEHYREYLQVHGAAKKISKFLGFLDVAERESLSKDIGLSGEDTIEKISNRLYELRSDFVHNGAPIWELDSHTAFTRRRNKDIVVRLQLEGFCKLFELCFLRYFGLLQAAERDSTLN